MHRARHRPDGVSPLDAALDYAKLGWRIFPCDRAKRPLTTHGFKAASDDPSQIRAWWQKHPDALIGFWPGPSDIAVLDIDMKNGKDGMATFARLEGCPILPPTPTCVTPTGGMHLHYKMPVPRIGATVGAAGQGIGDGLDWRGDAGYVILPSPGSGYRWEFWHYGKCAPIPVPIALMPRKIEKRGRRFTEGISQVNHKSLSGVLRCMVTAAEGERNNILYWAANRFAEAMEKGLIGGQDALALLVAAGQACGLDEREIRATVNSAFRASDAR
jgi:hypothetical protein